MIALYEFLLNEDGESAAGGSVSTPSGTIGMGNPSTPGLSDAPGDVEGSTPGSGDQFTAKCKTEKIKKKKSKK